MNKITKDFLESEITTTEYQRGPGTLTHCYITTHCGYVFTGESACVDPANFDATIGEQEAYKDAFNKMWSHYGLWLKKKVGENTPLSRMRIEQNELFERLTKLCAFLEKGKPDFLNDDEWALQLEQREHMTQYFNVLELRIKIAEAKLNGTAKK